MNRTRYPYGDGEMVIYTSNDWEQPIQPVEIDLIAGEGPYWAA